MKIWQMAELAFPAEINTANGTELGGESCN